MQLDTTRNLVLSPEPPNLSLLVFAVLSGLVVIAVASFFARMFIDATVRARQPDQVILDATAMDGGSRQLGLLEMFLFFAGVGSASMS
jgi:hypothetical protein